MKRLTILGIIACVGFLFAPAAVIGGPAGPPDGLDVKIIDQPVEVTGDVNATVTGDVNVANTPNVNVVNDEAYPVPVKVQNVGELVIIRDGYTVPDGKTLKIVDISVLCNLLRPVADEPLNIMATAEVNIFYPPDKCPEPLLPASGICPLQVHGIGIVAGYATIGLAPDGRPMIQVLAGRQVNIIAFEGAELKGTCPGGEPYTAGITSGIGYLLP